MAVDRQVTRTRPLGNGEPTNDVDQRRAFTGEKLDWMTALSADPRLDARAFEVGFCIAQHVNAESGCAIVSDETIADKTGIPKRCVLKSRQSLRDGGWIDWRRTKTANIYWTLGHRINAVTDYQIILKEKRAEKRSAARKIGQEAPSLAYLKNRKMPLVSLLKTSPKARRETPPVADIHLSSYTVGVTPSKVAQPSMVVVERGTSISKDQHDQNAASQPGRSLPQDEPHVGRTTTIERKVVAPSIIDVNQVAASSKNENRRAAAAYAGYPELPAFLDRRTKITTDTTPVGKKCQ